MYLFFLKGFLFVSNMSRSFESFYKISTKRSSSGVKHSLKIDFRETRNKLYLGSNKHWTPYLHVTAGSIEPECTLTVGFPLEFSVARRARQVQYD